MNVSVCMRRKVSIIGTMSVCMNLIVCAWMNAIFLNFQYYFYPIFYKKFLECCRFLPEPNELLLKISANFVPNLPKLFKYFPWPSPPIFLKFSQILLKIYQNVLNIFLCHPATFFISIFSKFPRNVSSSFNNFQLNFPTIFSSFFKFYS